MIQRLGAVGPGDLSPEQPIEVDVAPILATIAASGSDPAVDEVVGLATATPDGKGGYKFREWPGSDAGWTAFQDVIGSSPVLCPDGAVFERWYDHLAGRPGAHPDCLGLRELRALVRPGRRKAEDDPDLPEGVEGLEGLARQLAGVAREVHERGYRCVEPLWVASEQPG